MRKRIAAILFATVMLFSCFSVTAFAETSDYDYKIGDKATTWAYSAEDIEQPAGKIPDNSRWQKVGEYSKEEYTCGKEVHVHKAECNKTETKCVHKHDFFCGKYNRPSCGCNHKCTADSGCVKTVNVCGKEAHSHKGCTKVTKTFYKWELVGAFVVIWMNGDEVLEKDTNLKFGTTPKYDGETPTKEATAQYTYTFAGWYPPLYDARTCTYVYKAKFDATVNKYEVTWKDENGDVLKVDTVEYGTLPVYGEDDPVKEATAQYTYTFAGWTPEVVEVTGDAEYTATYDATVNTYTVTWYDEDGETVLEKDENVPYGSEPSFDGAEPTKAADDKYTYEFAGWEKIVADGETVEGDVVVGDVAYKATYTATEIPADESVVDEEATDEEVVDEEAVKTGDNMNVALYFGMMLLAALGMAAVVLKKRNA